MRIDPFSLHAKTRNTMLFARLCAIFLLFAVLGAGRLSAAQPMPDAELGKYLTITETTNTTPVNFNYKNRVTRNVSIAGKTVLFDNRNRKNQLFPTYSAQYNIKEMKIYAETLIIRSPVLFPQTAVTIFAREVRFEDIAGSPTPASLCTTPKVLGRPAGTVGSNGLDGLKAGDITANTESFKSPSLGVRWILTGGGGQPAGLGTQRQSGHVNARL